MVQEFLLLYYPREKRLRNLLLKQTYMKKIYQTFQPSTRVVLSTGIPLKNINDELCFTKWVAAHSTFQIYPKRLLLMNKYTLNSYQSETLATREIMLLMLIRFRQVFWKSCSAFTIRSRFAVQNFPHIFSVTPCFCIIHQHKLTNFFSSNFLCLRFAYFHKAVSNH